MLAEWTYYQSASYTRSVFLKLRLNGPDVAFDTMMWAPGQLLNQYAMSEAGRVVPRGDDVARGLGLVVRHEQQPLRLRRGGERSRRGRGPRAGRDHQICALHYGYRCYLVTFVQTDPLFVISLEATVPKVLGELKIPGFSVVPAWSTPRT